MKLIIGELEYDIKNFNHAIYYKDSDGRGIDSASATLKDVEDISVVGSEINEVFKGEFQIQTGARTITFTGFELTSVDLYIDEEREALDVRFERN